VGNDLRAAAFFSSCTIAGIEVMPAIRKGQRATIEAKSQTPAAQFYALVAQATKSACPLSALSKIATQPGSALDNEHFPGQTRATQRNGPKVSTVAWCSTAFSLGESA